MVPVKTLSVVCDHTFTLLANYHSRHQATSEIAVNLVIADDHFNLLEWICWGYC